ncbi:hypothetical protein PGB90_002168 [Kerria lacca]
MMHSSGRDSGYCENANSDICEAARIAADISPFFSNTTDIEHCSINQSLEAEKCVSSDEGVHLIVAHDEKVKDCMITGSSCRALKHAVSNLTRLDDFICERIGNGFFSEVYKVTHRVTGRVMVLKMNLLRSNRANMLKEVQLMNRLSHPNILKFMGVCVHEGQLHALTEYINGGSLEQLIQSAQELTYSVRMKLALDIAKGMQYLHSQDVFHRDLTSKNVLIKNSDERQEMTAVVGDFGLAAKIPRVGVRLPTVGSPWWMSPECLKGQWYDERSDIFSYGICLCELIARVDADPDILPRTSNFGLDYLAFVDICSQLPISPPPEFVKLAFSCCNLEPKNRPSFSDLVKILEKTLIPGNNGHYLINGCTLTVAKSEELLPCPFPSPTVPSKSNNSHKKLIHRRSLSEDIGLLVFPSVNSPSDKARCHTIIQQQHNTTFHPPLKHVGESMYQEDPHYKPSSKKSNPFASLSKFKGVKKVLGQTNSTDLFSSCFELPSPFYNIEVNDDPKPLFYTDNNTVDSKNKGKSDCSQLPYISEQCRRRCSPTKSKINSSSIIIEPVVKPSEIKKCSSKSFKLKLSSEESIVTKEENYKLDRANSQWQELQPVSSSSMSSSSSSTSSCNTSSATLQYKSDKKSKTERIISHFENYQPSSLPSSPTFSRRRTIFTNSANYRFPACKTTEDVEDIGSDMSVTATSTSKKTDSPLFLYPLYKSGDFLTDILLPKTTNYGNLLRSCSSSSNITALEEYTNTAFLPTTETPTHNLRRRGSCESGFYSSVGDDFCVPGIDVCVGHHHYTASSATLSSSSVASSLFLDSNSEDNSTPIFFNGRYPFTIHHHHNTSSVYTDSSEDVSSLASSETPPVWDDKQKPHHISKIVEYFERKQVGGGTPISHKLEFLDSSNRLPSLHTSIRRNWIHNDGQSGTRTSLDYYTRRKLFEKPFTSGSHVLPKRSINQRLLVCEGAVKSKLPIFDKK